MAVGAEAETTEKKGMINLFVFTSGVVHSKTHRFPAFFVHSKTC